MNMTRRFTAAVSFMVAAVLLLSGCSKDTDSYNTETADQNGVRQIEDRETQNDLHRAADRIPALQWYNVAMDKIVTFDPKGETKSFNFSDPNDGWNFSDADDVAWAPASGGGGILFIGPGSLNSNSAGGLVVAGNTSLDINYTFCFAASEQALGLDIGGFGGPEFDGISGVIGISGDFEALVNEEYDEDADPFDYFYGLAYYVVYDNEASGTYDILNWFNNLEEDPDDLGGNGFAWVYSFSEETWALYFSQDGELQVNGGMMNFNGSYFGLELNFDELEDGDIFYDFDYVEGPGYGSMGCN